MTNSSGENDGCLLFAVVRLIHPAPPPLNTIGPPSLAISGVSRIILVKDIIRLNTVLQKKQEER